MASSAGASSSPNQHVPRIHLRGASGEKIVRIYACTELKLSKSGAPVIGYLLVSNKRVVYYSEGGKGGGESLFVNEIHMEDVAGVSSYLSRTINWGRIFLLFVSYAFFAAVGLDIFPSILTSYFTLFLFSLPFLLVNLLTSDIVSAEYRAKAFREIERVTGSFLNISAFVSWEKYFAVLFYYSLFALSWRFTRSPDAFLRSMGWSLSIGLFIYIVIRFLARKNDFVLVIFSKNSQEEAITIPGSMFFVIAVDEFLSSLAQSSPSLSMFFIFVKEVVTKMLLSLYDTTALETITAAPGADAQQIARELGALILDVQQMGDAGVRKWRK